MVGAKNKQGCCAVIIQVGGLRNSAEMTRPFLGACPASKSFYEQRAADVISGMFLTPVRKRIWDWTLFRSGRSIMSGEESQGTPARSLREEVRCYA